MIKKCLFLLLFVPSLLLAQNPKKIDSLKSVLKTGKGKAQFRALIFLSDQYSDNNLNESMRYANEALLMAKKVKNDTFIGLANNAVANVFQSKSQPDSALFYYKKALFSNQKVKDSVRIADNYNNIGIVYDQQAQFPEALRNYFKALEYYDKKDAPDRQAMTYTNIGIVYKAQKEYAKALLYYRKAYQNYLKTNDAFGKTASAGNLGSILLNFGQYEEAIKYSEIAKTGYKRNKYDRFLGYPTATIAAVYDSLHQFDLANKNYTEAIRLHELYENGYEVAESANAFATSLIKQQKFTESIAFSNKAIGFAKKSAAYLLEVQAYKNLAKANGKLGNFSEAYKYSELYNIGKDSLFVNEKTKSVFELEAKYETTKKEKLLIQKDAEAQQKNILLWTVSILTLMIIAIALLIFRQQKLKNRQQKQEHELKTAIAQIETQNQLQEQRLSISRDLHDNIGAQLTFIISSVDNIKYAFDVQNPKLDHKLKSISDFTKDTILELRDTIWAMNNNEISFEDLHTRILNFIEKAKEAKENVNFYFAIGEELNLLKLSSITGMNVYRTLQEAINNAMKYSEATAIRITAKTIGDDIQISIQDNGKGFDKSTAERGNGLLNMEKRIEDIGGIYTLASEPGKGTTVKMLFKNNLNSKS